MFYLSLEIVRKWSEAFKSQVTFYGTNFEHLMVWFYQDWILARISYASASCFFLTSPVAVEVKLWILAFSQNICKYIIHFNLSMSRFVGM